MALARAVNRYASGFDVYIGRKSGHEFHFGNPFTHKTGTQASVVVGSREEAVSDYAAWLNGDLYQEIEPERRKWILAQIPSLVNKRLGCYCAPQACHGDVLAELATAYQISTSMIVAGVGSRGVPPSIYKLMQVIGACLKKKGYTVRTGDAKGSDEAFRMTSRSVVLTAGDATERSMEIASQYHGGWSHCNTYARKLHGRNVMQVLGANFDKPVRGVICWTPDGCKNHQDRTSKTGGTGTAISIASAHGIPVHNLKNPEDLKIWTAWIEKT